MIAQGLQPFDVEARRRRLNRGLRGLRDLDGLGEFPRSVLAAKQLLDAADGITFLAQKAVDSAGKGNVGRPVIAAVARALERPKLGKLGLPIAQDVLRDSKLGAELADRSESVWGFFAGRHADS